MIKIYIDGCTYACYIPCQIYILHLFALISFLLAPLPSLYFISQEVIVPSAHRVFSLTFSFREQTVNIRHSA